MTGVCSVDGCGRLVRTKGWCQTHYKRWRVTGVAGGEIAALAPRGSGHRRPDGRITVGGRKKRKLAYVVVVERLIGHPLPARAEVHHIDGDPSNDAHDNLVVCPDNAYHKLLHQRQRAFEACGHYDWRQCSHCKRYDAPENLWISTTRSQAHHRACDAKASFARYHRRAAAGNQITENA